MNPINLAVRFILEVTALLSIGIWGWKFTDQWFHYLLAIGIPIVFAIAWGTFNVVGDPSRNGEAPVIVSGIVRLVIELGIFAVAVWALYSIGYTKFSVFFAIAIIIHYIASYERIVWLLK